MRYIKITLTPQSMEEVDIIIENMRTTIPGEPIILEHGDTLCLVESDEALLREAFCLGACFSEMQAHGVEYPFDVEIVNLKNLPKSTGVTLQ